MDAAAMDRQMREGRGFVAALDQSGGSTPKALRLYGVSEDAYETDAEMFDHIHAMRARIATAPAFTGDKVLGAILFEDTVTREIDGMPTARYLSEKRGVVPFLKVDNGLEDAAHGAQLMKPIPQLDDRLALAREHGIYGTKMRSVIGAADAEGIRHNVAQQFELGNRIIEGGLMPILEPEITITIADKREAEAMLLDALVRKLDVQPEGGEVMLKLTLPEQAGLYAPLMDHARVARVVALSGGYDRAEATERLSRNPGMIASFSRALTEGLSVDQDDRAFNDRLGRTIDAIHAASTA